MKKHLFSTITALMFIGTFPLFLFAQLANLHGTDTEFKIGMHDGNNFRTNFFNDGTWGNGLKSQSDPTIYGGEWPINSGHLYLIDGNTYFISEVNDNYDPVAKKFLTQRGTLRYIESTVKSCNVSSSCGTRGPDQASGPFWWTFLPLPGFTNPANDKIAMAKGGRQWFEPANLGSWPPYWPDIADPSNPLYSADGWAGEWNGYFGRGKFNADQESYFVGDDYANQKFPTFRADTNNVSRGGLGVRMYMRGMQWSKGLIQDGVFVITDFKNIGTYQHNKVVFGYKIGNNVGDTHKVGGDGGDGGSYNIENNLAWTWDDDGLSANAASWGTTYGIHTGVFGACFLESPGDPYDGIDNDNDGNPSSPNYGMNNKDVGPVTLKTANGPKIFYAGSGPTITTDMFKPKILGLNDIIVLIDYNDPHYRRLVTTLADTLAKLGKTASDTLVIPFNGFPHNFFVGDTLQEIGDNLFDDNLNGIIDENRGVTTNGVINYLYVNYKYIDYKSSDVTTNGSLNPLIDERRDDGIDNDDNWNPLKDDVGADGLGVRDKGYPGPDKGEGDAKPTVGEPHFDKTDINESDMVGLTSFYLYAWGSAYNQWDDEVMWRIFTPGTFYAAPVGNVELGYGSGYFPLPPNTTERFSIGLIAADAEPTGHDTTRLFRTKSNFEKAYLMNYNFAKAPDIPIVTAMAGDHKVTLFWDTTAEASVDPSSTEPGGRDFEGYKIYRSTDPGWNDAAPITNGYGDVIFRKPIAQFDLNNGIKGFATVPTQAVHFYLGDDTGLKHMWVDTSVQNGMTYYYAVTSYDHGDASANIDPSECSKFVALQASGEVLKGTNVAVVRPEAPSAGYVQPHLTDSRFTSGPNNTTTGMLDYKIINPHLIKGNHKYRVTFEDALSSNSLSMTKSFTLIDSTSNDTLLSKYSATATGEGFPITDGFQLSFANNPAELKIDTSRSGWSREGIRPYLFKNFNYSALPVKLIPADFKVIFDTVFIDTSKLFLRGSTSLKAIPVNFKIINTLTNQKVSFALWERDKTGGAGKFTYKSLALQDQIIFLTPYTSGSDSLIASWEIDFATTATAPDTGMPGHGDTLYLNLDRPFLSNDTFEFTTLAPTVDAQLAKSDLDKIRVVPNPYIVANAWEPVNTYSTGHGERQLHFTHLPANCVIKIFTVNGQLVKTLYHNNAIDDGTEIWNMLSKDNLEISYGIYIYHVKAEGIGEKTGKILVLK
jgi:hypothetical protein